MARTDRTGLSSIGVISSLFLMVAACTPSERLASTAKPGAGADNAVAGHRCGAMAASHRDRWLGQLYEEARRDIVVMDEVETIRVIRPGDVVTMDHNPYRMNVELDAASTVRNVSCG